MLGNCAYARYVERTKMTKVVHRGETAINIDVCVPRCIMWYDSRALYIQSHAPRLIQTDGTSGSEGKLDIGCWRDNAHQWR